MLWRYCPDKSFNKEKTKIRQIEMKQKVFNQKSRNAGHILWGYPGDFLIYLVCLKTRVNLYVVELLKNMSKAKICLDS